MAEIGNLLLAKSSISFSVVEANPGRLIITATAVSSLSARNGTTATSWTEGCSTITRSISDGDVYKQKLSLVQIFFYWLRVRLGLS